MVLHTFGYHSFLFVKGGGILEVLQSYNQNAVSVVDNEGKELVLVGKGIGFGKKKGDYIDVKKASKIFQFYYSMHEKKIVDAIKDISEDILLMAEEVTEIASKLLNEELNPAFLFTLSNHIQFAIERTEKYGEIQDPLNYELKYIYPTEYAVAVESVNYLRKKYQLNLSDSEITFFTFHFVNGLQSTGNFNQVVKLSDILKDITELIDKELNAPLQKDSIQYSRFILHMRYFLIRQFNKNIQSNPTLNELYQFTAQKFNSAHSVVLKIENLLIEEHDCDFSSEENLYLLLHLQRLLDENNNRG